MMAIERCGASGVRQAAEAGQVRDRRIPGPKTVAGWMKMAGSLAFALGLVLVATDDLAAQLQRSKKPARRTPAPAGKWDKGTVDAFFADAFAKLEGSRPANFGAGRGAATAAVATTGGAAPSPGGSSGGGFKWSGLVSGDTLADEVKEMKDVLAAACGKISDFKGGGYDKARCGFSSLAIVFGVIAAYDQPDVRWRKDAETARDLFARVGVNCKVGTDHSFAEAKARLADLEKLLEGGSPEAKADVPPAVKWSEMSGRPPLMKRLEMAQEVMRPGIASKADFDKTTDVVLHAAEIIAVIGEAIQQPDYEYFDDDTYKGYAAGMRDAAKEIRDACQKGDYDSARTAFGKLDQSCNACHGDYRS